MLGHLAEVISQSSALSSLFVFHNVFLLYPPIFSYHAKDTSLIYLFHRLFFQPQQCQWKRLPLQDTGHLPCWARVTSLPAGMRVGPLSPEPSWNQPLSQCSSQRGWLPAMRSRCSLLPLLPHRGGGMWIKHRKGTRRRNDIPRFLLPSPKPNQLLVARMPLLEGSPPGPAAPWLCSGRGAASLHPSWLPLGAHPDTGSPVQKGLKHHSAFPGYPPTWQAVSLPSSPCFTRWRCQPGSGRILQTHAWESKHCNVLLPLRSARGLLEHLMFGSWVLQIASRTAPDPHRRWWPPLLAVQWRGWSSRQAGLRHRWWLLLPPLSWRHQRWCSAWCTVRKGNS